MSNKMIQHFFEFIYDRQEIWYKRNILQLPQPWSDDEIFQTFKFCNVYRELDGGTLAIRKYLQELHSPEQKLFNIIAYRFFNRRDTIEKLFGGLLDPNNFDIKTYEKRLDKIKKKESIFSNAYLICSHPYDSSYRPKDKHVQILLMLNNLRPKLHEMIKELRSHTPQEGLYVIRDYVKMTGPFLAGQILLDTTYAGNIVNYNSNDFLVVGPGANWGLKIIFNMNNALANEKCRLLHANQKEEFATLKENTGKDWFAVRWQNPNYPNAPYLSLHDIQNSLCEFRKYWRLKGNEKAKKRYFNKNVAN